MQPQELIDEISQNWLFNAERYPEMKDLSPEGQKVFAIRHILMHQMKSLGALAEIIERYEHGNPCDYSKLNLIVAKLLSNVLRLADIAGLKAEDLFEICRPPEKITDSTQS